MSNWKLIKAEGTTNQVENPSFEENVTDGWTFAQTGAGGSVTQDSTYSKWGAYNAKLLADDTTNSRFYCDVFSLANGETLYVSAWILKTTAFETRLMIQDSTTPATRATTTDITSTGGLWERQYSTWTNTTGGALNVRVLIQNHAADNASIVYIDGVQAEIDSSSYTTYCDGDQPGCEWNGTAHASTSTRSAASRKGGVIKDLYDDYHFTVESMIGVGAAQQDVIMDSYASQPGGELNSIGIPPRVFSLVGTLSGGTVASLHANRQLLLDELNPTKYTQEPQPVRLRYTGAAVDKEIDAFYTGGMEGDLQSDTAANYEKMALRFEAPDPWFYEVGESSQILDSNDSATLRYITARLRSTGQWDDLGLTSNPDTNGTIYAIAYNPVNKKVYIGGDFEGLDGEANRDYIAAYNLTTGAFETVGAGAAVGDIVRAIAIAPNGDVYIGGDFTNVADADGDYVAYYDLSGGSWASVSSGGTGDVYALTFGHDGKLYIGGDFSNWNAIDNADNIVVWTGAAYAALGVGANGDVFALATHPITGDIYAGGAFLLLDGETWPYIGYWDISASDWARPGTGVGDVVRALDFAPNGDLYAGGDFTTITDALDAALRVAKFAGTEWEAMGDGVGAAARAIKYAPDGSVYVVGSFTAAGGRDALGGTGRWNGSDWSQPDLNLPGSYVVYSTEIGAIDPVIPRNFDLYIGFSTTGTGNFAGTATATNDGTALAFPRLVIKRSGGTVAAIVSCRNETQGRILSFDDYNPVDGETIIIDTHPNRMTKISSYFGAVPRAELVGDDLGEFALLPGANQITLLVDTSDATITGYLLWRNAYSGLD